MKDNKKYKWYLMVGLILLAGVVAYLLFNNSSKTKEEPRSALLAEPKIYLYTNGIEATGQISVSVPFTKAIAGHFKIDVGLDVNKDGQISDTEWQVKDTSTFLTQNLRNNFWLVDSEKSLAVGDTVLLSVRLRSDVAGIGEVTLDKNVTTEAFEIGELLGLNVEGSHEDLKRGIGLPQAVVQTAYADGEVEPVFRNATTPDLSQGPMECAAVSAANGLMSLAGEHDQLNKLPKFTGELIEELKTDMKYSGKGILLPNMVAGKNAFTQRHNLPVVTTIKYAPTKEDIEQALRSGAAVELSFAFVMSKSGRDNTGHVMTLVGGSPSELYVHDSSTPEGMDPLRMFGTVQTPKQTFINVPYPLWDGVAYIDAIVIQNWTTPVMAEESYTAAGEQGSEVEMLVIGGQYFPKSLFRVGEHGSCNASHYHSIGVEGLVHGLKSKDSTEIVTMTDPLPDSCGFGKVAEVPVEKITITLEQSEQLIKYLPN
ncbi:MAG: hypothetical protein AAB618_02405 [Patescibacteria group bacterium]